MSRLTTFLLSLSLSLCSLPGCGPLADGALPKSGATPAGGPRPVLTVVVHNLDVAFVETATVSYWKGSTIDGKQAQVMPKGGEAWFDLPELPDGLEIDALAWPAISGGNVFGRPDYARFRYFHVAYPTGFTWGQ